MKRALNIYVKPHRSLKILYVWLKSADLAVSRVEERVRRGGHGVAEEVIRRRYVRGLRNFFKLYMPIADAWALSDNSTSELVLIAEGGINQDRVIHEEKIFQEIERAARSNGGDPASKADPQ